MSDELAFLESLRKNPGEETTRLVYADWLDEQNESKKAAYLRALVELRKQVNIIKGLNVDCAWSDLVTNARQDLYDAYLIINGLNYLPMTKVREWLKTDETNNFINVGTVAMTDFNSLLGNSIKERYEHLCIRISEIFLVLARKVSKARNGWILTSPEISSIFETCASGFRLGVTPEYLSEGEEDHPVYIGLISNKWSLYRHNLFPQGIVLMGVGRGEDDIQTRAILNLLNFVF